MKFNLVNPSDPYTFEAPDLATAAVAVCLLGDGKYLADEIGDVASTDNHVPAFLFGGHDEWFEARFGGTYEVVAGRVLKERPGDLAACLESVKLGRDLRSSLNDIGGKARELARIIREGASA